MLTETGFGYGRFSFSWGDHICAIFESHEQQMEVMVPFIATGLRASQRCVWIAPPESAQGIRAALGEVGGDLRTLEGSGQLVVMADVDFYLREGVFEPERTIDLMLALFAEGRAQGYQATRATTDVSWLGTRALRPEVWGEYEMRVSEEMVGRAAAWVCQYNARQLGGDIVVTALQTHPVVILGDTIKQNPFYTVPGSERAPQAVH